VGIWTEDGRINLNCGATYPLELPNTQSADERDRMVGQIIMQHIAQLLPEHLGGNYIKNLKDN
jgi:hypothetical protein